MAPLLTCDSYAFSPVRSVYSLMVQSPWESEGQRSRCVQEGLKGGSVEWTG